MKNPEYTIENLAPSRIIHIPFQSEMLQKEMGLNVLLPGGYDETQRYPVLYLLHGRSGSEDIMNALELNRVVDNLMEQNRILPLIIVCPRMENSRGLNSSKQTKVVETEGCNINIGMYEDYFIKEAVPFIDREYKTVPDRKSRFVGGVSGGGYAAVTYGLKYPGMFSRIGGHIPALELQLEEEDIPFFGSEAGFARNNPLAFDSFNEQHRSQKWYLDAGDCDEGGFYEGCRMMSERLKPHCANVQCNIFKGHHNLQYIRSNLEKYLIFYAGKN